MQSRARSFLWLAVLALMLFAPPSQAGRRRQSNPPHEPAGHLTWASPQSNPIALQPSGQACSDGLLVVASTTSNLVDVVDTASLTLAGQIEVGIEPVSVAFRPDGCQAWVSNHVSDTVSVIDTSSASASYLHVVETVQDLDANGATRFDEPVGIAFKEDGSQAYVALSSRNDVAIVDTASYAVTGRVHITAQEPRALAVRNGRLYVAAFESGNQSELSACGTGGGIDAQCSIWAIDIVNFSSDLLAFVTSPNMPGNSKNIVIDPDVPDRDLFVFDVSGISGLADGAGPTDVLSGVGTLLYGLTVSSTDRVYVTQTDARNAVNGNDSGSVAPSDVVVDGDVNLMDLQNRMFLNQIAEVDCAGGPCTLVGGAPHDLEEPPGTAVTTPLATPYGIALAESANLLVVTAAASSRIFTWDATTDSVLDTLGVGSIPRGVALDPAFAQDTGRAYVLETLANTVQVVDVDLPTGTLTPVGAPIAVGNDPRPASVRLGRIAFNDADASTSGTFACASCHPDGHTDQLLWRIGGECFLGGCIEDEDEPRSTMPVRGLRDSVPLHWDGILGDPFGGPDGSGGPGGVSQTIEGSLTCTMSNQFACFLDLVEASLSGVMCDQSSCTPGPSGEAGLLDDSERANMATFLESVSYPPARSRRMNDEVSTQSDPTPVEVGGIPVGGVEGFEDFFFDQGSGSLQVSQPDTCADSDAGCHELPLGTANNSESLANFDAPTMRGMTDRTLQFSLGISHTEELLAFANPGLNIPASVFPPNGLVVDPIEAPIQWDPSEGPEEITTFAAAFAIFQPTYNVRPLDIFQMFEEASTGHSGALGRQVTLNTATAGPCTPCDLDDTLAVLESADADGLINLRGSGSFFGSPRTVSYDASAGLYRFLPGSATRTRSALIGDAQSGVALLTLTAQLRSGVAESVPQPLIAPLGAQCDAGTGTSGDPDIPTGTTITIESAHVDADDVVILNGAPTAATINVLGALDACDTQGGPALDAPDEITQVHIQIANIPRTGGTDLLQILSTEGLLSNELPLP